MCQFLRPGLKRLTISTFCLLKEKKKKKPVIGIQPPHWEEAWAAVWRGTKVPDWEPWASCQPEASVSWPAVLVSHLGSEYHQSTDAVWSIGELFPSSLAIWLTPKNNRCFYCHSELGFGVACYTAKGNCNRDCEGGQILLMEELPFKVHGKEQQGKIKLKKLSQSS